MSRGANYINAQLGPLPAQMTVKGFVLSAVQAAALGGVLSVDARDHYYSACVSLIDAIHGLVSGFYSWSTVKCYYATFYSLRAFLATDGVCIVHVPRQNKTSEFWIDARAGSTLRTSANDRGTHKLTLGTFQRRHGGHRLLSNPIGGELATTWLMNKREECNYRVSRFREPVAPTHFSFVERYGVRKLLMTYLGDSTDTYTFLEEHAMLAYPLAALTHVGRRMQSIGGAAITEREMGFLNEKCCDSQGRLTPILEFLKRVS